MNLFFSFLVSISLFLGALYGDPLLPASLKKGDLIALVFPGSYLDKDKDTAEKILIRKAQWLKSKGYRTIYYPKSVHPYGYLAGSDKERADALMAAWSNPEVKAIWCVRGGYGCTRILNLLNYDKIKANPKIFIGMSDVTALHIALHQKAKITTFLGPVFNYFDEAESKFDQGYALTALEEIVSGPSHQISYPKQGVDYQVIKAGKAKGRVVGGNLTLLATLCGTEWQLNTDNKILLLEDVDEEVYRIDRMLCQLKNAGMLDKPAAVILASWDNCKSTFQNGLTLHDVFQEYFEEANYPVIIGFPSGHINNQATVPLNALMEIDTAKKGLKVLEPVVRNK